MKTIELQKSQFLLARKASNIHDPGENSVKTVQRIELHNPSDINKNLTYNLRMESHSDSIHNNLKTPS